MLLRSGPRQLEQPMSGRTGPPTPFPSALCCVACSHKQARVRAAPRLTVDHPNPPKSVPKGVVQHIHGYPGS